MEPIEKSLMNEHENTRTGAIVNSDTYLYGRSILDLKSEPYEVVLLAKIHLTKLLMHDLVHVGGMNDSKRIQAVKKAEEFNRELLKEIGYTDPIIAKALKVIEDTKNLNKVVPEKITYVLLSNLNESVTYVSSKVSSIFTTIKGKL